MDALTHVFLPLTIAYVLRRDLFQQPQYLLLGLFGLVSDLDKPLGVPGLLHSLVTLVPICLILIVIDYWYRDDTTYGLLTSAFVLSHPVLDILEGVTVPLLYPLVATGVGFTYPMTVVFGPDAGALWFALEGPPVALEFGEPRLGHATDPDVTENTYGVIDGYGVASTLTFLFVYGGLEWQERRERGNESP
ncbi:hypothetical protein CV102_22660 [Natronococcus pandeyae]|uniref:Uncharacterized protein n=1 Tax=Natronococcus pandeyae TaxID=2055836 RepID=A0A8J8TNK9_9EURY|nr:metal-dependent hydrolase [Natronococcus pandeyae]TYL36428.1 hypothetical protein CV102_22660 [Natronococcus pandeyae]